MKTNYFDFRRALPFLATCFIASLLTGCQSTSKPPATPTLKSAFRHSFRVGAALNSWQFTGQNPAAVALITNQFNTITPENVMKWGLIHPELKRYDFSLADQYVEFGRQHGMFIVGHNLIWHEQTPDAVFHNILGVPYNRETLLKIMHDHIFTVVGRYKGKIGGWDVVNEAVADDGTLRQSPWMKIIGEDYLVKAYQWAHEADPKAELYYNDYSTEAPTKRAGIVRLIKMMQAHGIHLTAIGSQEHDTMSWPPTNEVNDMINNFSALGVKVMITELDVNVLTSLPGDPFAAGLSDSQQRALANRYTDLFKVFLQHPGVITRVTFWGVGDGNSWLNQGRHNYPLLFDRNYQPKPAYDAVMALRGRLK